jgi:predicted metal-dependent hydrolase
LGKQYQLKVIESTDQPQGVKLLRGKLQVALKQKNTHKVQDLLNAWYRVRAKEVFSNRIEAVLSQALWVTEMPKLKLLNMKTQWGNCSPSGNLTLNPYLVKAPTRCIDYVILHELCHLVEHNHSKQFYELMSQTMPDWEGRKIHLDEMAAKIFSGAI